MLAMKYCSMPFSLIIGLPKSIWISLLGSMQFGRCDHLLCRITGFKFFPISVQALHSLALANISRWIYSHQIFCARDSIAKLPGCVEWMPSSTASLIAFWVAIISFIQRQPFFTLTSHQFEWIYVLISFSLSLSFRMTQSRTSFNIASLPVRAASSFLLKIQITVFASLWSSTVFMALVEGVVFVFDGVFVARVVLDGELSEKVIRVFVGVDFAVLFGIIEIALITWVISSWNLGLFWERSRFFLKWWCLYLEFDTFAPNLKNLWWFLELLPNIGFIGSNCSVFSHFLLSDFSFNETFSALVKKISRYIIYKANFFCQASVQLWYCRKVDDQSIEKVGCFKIYLIYVPWELIVVHDDLLLLWNPFRTDTI